MILLLLQAALLGAAVLLLFRYRATIGLAPLYVMLGALQVVQTLGGAVLVSAAPGLSVSPGSAVLFSAGLFTVLLVYIREDAIETRKLIYALAFANIVAGVLLYTIAWQAQAVGTLNFSGLSAETYERTAYNLLVGTGLLIIDAVLLVILYELFARHLGGVFVPIACTMIGVLCLDSVGYVSLTFWGRPDYVQILRASMLSKVLAGLWFALAATLYLRRHERESDATTGIGVRDIFSILTYRQKYELLRAAAVRDDLTGVFNRAYFNANFAGAVQDAVRSQRPLAVMFADIDRFKATNDDYGHLVGDRIIAAVAQLILGRVRETDWVCRYGGEEFVVVLPGAPADAVARLGEAIRSTIGQGHTVDGVHLPLSITIGIAALPEDSTFGSELLKIADRRLYAGKKAGRNRVVSTG